MRMVHSFPQEEGPLLTLSGGSGEQRERGAWVGDGVGCDVLTSVTS